MPLRGTAPTGELPSELRPLLPYAVDWQDVTDLDACELANCVLAATSERPIQQHLESHPHLLSQLLHGGHGRWIIPQQRLGAQHVTDFLLAERASLGFEWHALELESPTAKPFTRAGNPSAALTHAIRQIQDWRQWLMHNLDYARRLPEQSGLGLSDIDCHIHGLVVIGRRCSHWNNKLRRQIAVESHIEVRSYDWLISATHGQIAFDRWESSEVLYGKPLTEERWNKVWQRMAERERAERTRRPNSVKVPVTPRVKELAALTGIVLKDDDGWITVHVDD